jgi:glycyl-tRNA synthetase (class II)
MITKTYRPLISEVLRKVNNAKTKEEKRKILLENNTQVLRSLFIWNYDDSIVSLLPEGEVPYVRNPAPEGTDHLLLENEGKKLFHFVKGGSSISQAKREQIFLGILEQLHPDEAEVLCLVKDKELQKKYTRISKALIEETFPQIKWGGRS